jgi:hypothetical protein
MYRALFLSFIIAATAIAREDAVTSAPINNGFVLIDGVSLDPPFELSKLADTITLNGQQLVLPQLRGGGGHARGPRKERLRRHPERSATHHSLGQIEGMLRLDGLILISKEGQCQILSPSRALPVLNVLSSQISRDEKLNALANFPSGNSGSAGWRDLLESFASSPLLAERLADAQARHAKPAASNPRVNNALSILGFLLAAVALGTLLLHRPDTGNGVRGINPEPLAMRRVLQAGILLSVLAIYDLVATLTLTQAGLVVEVNPLASGFIHNPVTTTIFKLGITGIAIALLVALRRHRPAQVAAWWACVINTVLLLRWATVTSTIV